MNEYKYKGYTIKPYYNHKITKTLYIIYDNNDKELDEWHDSLNDAKYHIDHINNGKR